MSMFWFGVMLIILMWIFIVCQIYEQKILNKIKENIEKWKKPSGQK